MREVRNAILIIVLFILGAWAFYTWFVASDALESRALQRVTSLIAFAACGALLIWAMKFQDKLPDQLAELTGGIYYERDGLCFMPVMRKQGDRAFLCIYYENRFENQCDSIVHLRPPPETIQHRPDAYDMHFAFSVPGGAVGVIHQPVAVHPRQQGQVVELKMAAAINYPHNRGDQLRSKRGIPCGTFEVDWGTSFRTGMHEHSGEIELIEPITIRLAIPRNVSNRIRAGQHWRQELLSEL